VSATTRYASLEGGHVPPFLSWANAATSIQAAIDVALPGETVLVTNGIYDTGGRVVLGALTNRIAITKPIAIQSVNGSGITVIRGAWHPGTTNGDTAIRCAYIADGAVLAGFTLTSGATRESGDYDQEEEGGGAWCESGGVLSNCVLTGNSGLFGGGAYNGMLNNCIFAGNSARYGGASSYGTLNNCALTSNSAIYGGGAYYGTLDNCTLTGNSSSYGGGASGATLNNCTLTGNSTSGQYGSGGGASGGTLNSCALSNNSATYGGGTYYATLVNCTLISNSASYGGGVNGGTLSNCMLVGNLASSAGGASSGGVLNNCALVGNLGSSTGGGASGGTLNNCTLMGNSVSGPSGSGGGASSATLNDCELRANSATNGGGSSFGTLNNCRLTGNSAGYGGGAYFGTLHNCTFMGNSASFSGGGTYQGSLDNCVFAGNSATSGGGASDGALNNCTLVGNSASSRGGGASYCAMNNCIVYYNAGLDGENWSYGTLRYCCTIPMPDGAGNITNPPVITSESSPHLLPGSPCIDAGNNAYAVGIDIDGQSRIANGTVDIGCDEFTIPCTGALGVAIQVVWTNVAPGCGIPFKAVVTGIPESLIWQWGDGSGTTNLSMASHAYINPGTYDVVLTARNASGSASCTARVQVVVATTRYAGIGGGHVPPFVSWANAATSIQAAIDTALPGETVLVTNGIYDTGGRVSYGAMTNRIAVTKPLFVRSANGPDVTVIRGAWHPGTTNGDSSVRCAYVTNGATLIGFTLTNGATRATGDYFRERSGGGAWCDLGGILSNCTIAGNVATNGGGAYCGVLNNCVLTGNRAFCGGGVSGSTLNNCMLVSNSAMYGAGTSYSTLNRCTVASNLATGYGGCSYYGTLNNCTLTANAASYGGGAAYSVLKGCALANNLATNGGGGSYYGTLDSCTLTGNATRGQYGSGGGAYNGALTNCTLTGNSAYDGGGSHGGTLNECTFIDNLAASSGGGSSWGLLSNCTLSGNLADVGGGSYGSTVNDCTLSGNTARYGGGSSWDTLNNCVLVSNSASSFGGGSSYSTLNNCTLMGNSATNGGGANEGMLNNCTLTRNSASSGGGSLGATLNNCILTKNAASVNGGGSAYGTLNNCTLTGNSATSGGGSFYGTLSNCIVCYNTALEGANWYRAMLQYCCTTPLPSGTGNITNAPLISSALCPHLLTGSPCIDAGLNDCAIGVDIDGQPRIANGTVDIGCDEYTPPCTGPLGVAIAAAWTNMTPGYAIPFEAVIAGTAQFLVWRWGDGSGTTNNFLTSHAYANPGTYDVVLTAINASSSASCTTRVQIVAATVRHVATGGGHVIPYASWANAATSIQAAIDVALPGETVLVTNGVYGSGGSVVHGAMTNRIAITKLITVQSVNGPAVTVIRGAWQPGTTNGDSAVRCAYVTNGALLTGFTLTNGATRLSGDDYRERRGGGVWCEPGGILSNCILKGNSAYYGGGGAYGTLNNCTLTGNLATSGGGTACSTLHDCTLVGNFAIYGGGVWGSTLETCTLVDNSAGYYGGGACDSALNNCTLTGNSAGLYGGGSYTGTLNNCTLTGNSARSHGGGSSCSTLNRCTLKSNSALAGGGSHDGMLNSCTLMGNSAEYGGGANGDILNNCMLTDNTASSGGAAYDGRLNNCTLMNNSARDSGGGVFNGTLTNCVVYYNSAPSSPNWFNSTLGFCCTMPGPTGTGNITNAPLIAGLSNPHLLEGSPCIDAGLNDCAIGVDIDGQPRIANGAVDIGCDEYTPPCTGTLGIAILCIWTNVATGCAIPFEAVVTGMPQRLLWQWGDGSRTMNSCLTSHAYTNAGTYEVVLTASNASSFVSCTTRVQVVSVTTRYVSLGGGHVPPFISWANAATSIQTAIDVALPGETVVVTNGVYDTGGRVVYGAMTNRIVITKPIAVESVNGPDGTVIKGRYPIGSNAVRCAYVTKGAVLVGFTLVSGATRNSGDDYQECRGGGAWCEPGGILSNCTLTGNSANTGGGAYNGTLYNCMFTSNAASQGGGASDGTLNNCTLIGNRAAIGGGAYNGTLNNCIFVNNSASYSGGGGVYKGMVNNCMFRSNWANNDGGGAYEGTLNNCTLIENSAGRFGGGTRGSTLNNCVVYYNTALDGANWYDATLRYCCSTPLPDGLGNNTNVPLIASAVNPHLLAGSPCIDAGANTYAVGVDIDGQPRIVNGTVDIGYDEYTQPTTGTLGVAILAIWTNVATGCAIPLEAVVAGAPESLVWQWDDGLTTTNSFRTSHPYASTGTYNVVLTASNGASLVSCTTRVQVVTGTTRYVMIGGGNTPPFSSWATAARTIQTAIDVALPGETVLVSNGWYSTGGCVLYGTLSNRIAITKPITVRSVNGPADTSIRGQGPCDYDAVRCAYVADGAVLAGFTLDRGATCNWGVEDYQCSGGGAWCGPGGILSNCWLLGNAASDNLTSRKLACHHPVRFRPPFRPVHRPTAGGCPDSGSRSG
jgi:PKD repeat protein